MKCKYCGNDVPEGEIYCSCGNPVTYENSSESGLNGGISESLNDSPVVSPVAAVSKKKGLPRALVSIIIIVVIAAVGFGYQYYKNVFSLTHSGTYKEVSGSGFTMNIHRTLKKESSSDKDIVAFYTSEKAAVNISKLNYSDNPGIESVSIDEYASLAEAGGFDGEFKKDGDLVYACYYDSAIGTLKEKQKCYVIEGLIKGDDAIWSVNAYCLSSDKEKYEDALLEWVKSFELK